MEKEALEKDFKEKATSLERLNAKLNSDLTDTQEAYKKFKSEAEKELLENQAQIKQLDEV
jgi:hypothetical protein